MAEFIPWSSQPLEQWASKYAQGKFINLGGRQTHYVEKGEGEPLILLHGFFYDSYLWAENIDALAQNFKVYALDLWGCGYSTRDPLDYGYPLYADQILMFMDSLGIERASIAGQSMGGGAAVQFCLQHRQRVNKLVLVSAAGLPNPIPLLAKFFNLPRIGEFFLALNSNAMRKGGLVNFFIYDKNRLTDSHFDNITRAHKIAGSTEAGLKIQRKEFFDKLSDEIHQLGKIDVPILIVWGRKDKAIPLKCGQEMQRILKNARLAVIDNAGHVPNFDRAEEFNQLAVNFLRE
ncbi:MAG: alpha/beta hydrolase [Pseudomonadota bacterium]